MCLGEALDEWLDPRVGGHPGRWQPCEDGQQSGPDAIDVEGKDLGLLGVPAVLGVLPGLAVAVAVLFSGAAFALYRARLARNRPTSPVLTAPLRLAVWNQAWRGRIRTPAARARGLIMNSGHQRSGSPWQGMP